MSFDDFDDPYSELNDVPEGLRQVPALKIIQQGKKTYLKNYSVIVQKMKRNERDIRRFIVKELGIPAKLVGGELIFQGSVAKDKLIQIVGDFIKKYILCPNCGKPDTMVVKNQFRCTACGFTRKL